jgi:hypothetical protein
MAQIILTTNSVLPSTPTAGTIAIYSRLSDHRLYIKDSTGADYGLLDGRGSIFAAYQSTLQSIPNTTPTKVNFDTQQYMTVAGEWSTTLSRFLPVQSGGFYQINAGVELAIGATGTFRIDIYRNGVLDKQGTTTPTDGANACAIVSSLIYFNGATDYIEIFATQVTGAAHNTVSGIAATYINGSIIRQV